MLKWRVRYFRHLLKWKVMNENTMKAIFAICSHNKFYENLRLICGYVSHLMCSPGQVKIACIVLYWLILLVQLDLKRWFVFKLFRKRVIAADFIAGSIVPCVKNDELRGLFEHLTLSNVTLTLNAKLRN